MLAFPLAEGPLRTFQTFRALVRSDVEGTPAPQDHWTHDSEGPEVSPSFWRTVMFGTANEMQTHFVQVEPNSPLLGNSPKYDSLEIELSKLGEPFGITHNQSQHQSSALRCQKFSTHWFYSFLGRTRLQRVRPHWPPGTFAALAQAFLSSGFPDR